MVSRDAGVEQGDHGESRVPDRRLARLGPEAVAFVDRETLPTLDGSAQRLVLEPVPERGQHDDRPDPRRLDSAPGAVGFLPVANPPLGSGERNASDRPRPRRRPRLPRPSPDLAQVDRRPAHRTKGLDDRERDNRLPRPAGERVDRERPVGREQDDLGRHPRHPLPGPMPEEGQEALREHARARDAAFGLDELARARTRIDARQLQRGVRLDRRREVARPVEPDRPRAVVTLPREQLVRDLAVEVVRAKPEEVMPEQVLRDHRRVRLELAYPPAVRVLELEQAGRGTVDGRVQRRPYSVRRDCQTATLVVTPDNILAAAPPLRTAASIV